MDDVLFSSEALYMFRQVGCAANRGYQRKADTALWRVISLSAPRFVAFICPDTAPAIRWEFFPLEKSSFVSAFSKSFFRAFRRQDG